MTGPTAAERRLAALKRLRRRARRLRARSRLRAANLRRTGAELRRRPAGPPPADPAPVLAVETVWGAPRTLLWVTVKRDNPTLRDLYGHWWVEAGEQSWGWWPRAVPVGLRQLARGTEGVLNGVGLIGRTGTWSRDAQHGQPVAHAFHPVLIDPVPDDEVASRLRRYAQGYAGQWQWAWTRRAEHDTCRSFQDGLLQAAGLTEGREHLASRGSGCPFIYPPRTLLWRAQDLLEAARRHRASLTAGALRRLAPARLHRCPQAGQLGLLPRCPYARTAAPANAPDPPQNPASDRCPERESNQVVKQLAHRAPSSGLEAVGSDRAGPMSATLHSCRS